MPTFPSALPHGPLTEVFPDVFTVTGTFRQGPGIAHGRNMTVVRHGTELSVINSVRLTPEGEAALDKLGTVKHLLRIGYFHGADDPYFMDRYKPTLWAPARMPRSQGMAAGEELRPGACPIPQAQVFLFESGQLPEAVIVLERDGGTIVTCDSFQNWTHFDDASLLGKLMLRMMRFGPAMIGPIWAKKMGPGVRGDFDKLLGLEWRHALSGHGEPIRDTGKDAMRAALTKYYG